jgi:serine/threonine protein kinase
MIGSIEDLKERLADVPSAQLRKPTELLQEYPDLQDDRRATRLIVVEAYVRELERGRRIDPTEFVQSYPHVSADLAGELAGIAELHSRLGLWSAGAPPQEQEIAWPQVGEIVRGYKLLQEIGRGAFSRVFVAADSRVGHRRVAVKFTPHAANELTSLGTLVHPHLPRILTCDHDADRNLWMICMEYIGTRSVIDLVQELHRGETGRPVSSQHRADRAVAVVRQIADALVHAHERGTLHLDVKPANILLRGDDEAVLIDFNLSAPACSASGLGFRGTLAYAAPEVAESARTGDLAATPISAACDIYSLGVVLFELLTGRVPWPSGDATSVDDALESLAAKQARVIRPSAIAPDIDPELDEIVATAMAFAPEKRFASMREFRDALDHYHTSDRTKTWRRSASPRWVLAACILLILGFVVFQPSPGHQQAEQLASLGRSPQFFTAVSRAPAIAPTPHVGIERSGMISPSEVSLDRLGQPPQVRWAELAEDELREIHHLLTTTPPPAGEAVRAAAEGYVLMLLREYSDASSRFREASTTGLADDAGVNANLGYCYIQQRQFGGASMFLERAIRQDPDIATVLFLRSVVELEVSRRQNRRPERQYLDRLIGLETPLAERLATALEQHRARLTQRVTHGAGPTTQHPAGQRAASPAKSGTEIDHASVPDSVAVDIIRPESDPFPLAHVHTALAADINLTTSFHPDVDDYLDLLHRTHLAARRSEEKKH